jgi:hypothetical protein
MEESICIDLSNFSFLPSVLPSAFISKAGRRLFKGHSQVEASGTWQKVLCAPLNIDSLQTTSLSSRSVLKMSGEGHGCEAPAAAASKLKQKSLRLYTCRPVVRLDWIDRRLCVDFFSPKYVRTCTNIYET